MAGKSPMHAAVPGPRPLSTSGRYRSSAIAKPFPLTESPADEMNAQSRPTRGGSHIKRMRAGDTRFTCAPSTDGRHISEVSENGARDRCGATMARNYFSVAGVEADGRQHQHVQPVPGGTPAPVRVLMPSSFGTRRSPLRRHKDGTRFLSGPSAAKPIRRRWPVVVNWLSAAVEIVISRPFRT